MTFYYIKDEEEILRVLLMAVYAKRKIFVNKQTPKGSFNRSDKTARLFKKLNTRHMACKVLVSWVFSAHTGRPKM